MSKLFILADLTIWFTPIIFLSSLIKIIKLIFEGKDYKLYLIACLISFWLIVVPLFVAVLNLGWQ